MAVAAAQLRVNFDIKCDFIFTLTFHKITPGEGAEARFEQSDSR